MQSNKEIKEAETLIEFLKITLSSDSIGKTWKVIRNIFGCIFIVTSLLTSPVCPIVFAPNITLWLGWITLVSGVIAGKAQLDKSNIKR